MMGNNKNEEVKVCNYLIYGKSILTGEIFFLTGENSHSYIGNMRFIFSPVDIYYLNYLY
jgi:hypothetical protein